MFLSAAPGPAPFTTDLVTVPAGRFSMGSPPQEREIEEFRRRGNLEPSQYDDRLPTEAEWEYARRAGTTTPFATGENLTAEPASYDSRLPYAGFAPGLSRANRAG